MSSKHALIGIMAVAASTLVVCAACSSSPTNTDSGPATPSTSGSVSGSSQSSNKGTIVVGAAEALTGPDADSIGIPFADGIKLAAKDINSQGGILGHQIKVDIQDHKSSSSEGALLMQQFVSQGIPVVLSSFTNVILAQAPIATRAKTLIVNPGGSSDALANASPYLYTTRPFASREFPVLAQEMQRDGLKQISLIGVDSTYGRDGVAAMEQALKAAGIQVAGTAQYYDPDTKDFSPYIAKIRSYKPDGIFVFGLSNDGGLFVNQAVAQGLDVRYFAADSFGTPPVLQAAGSAASHVTFVQPVVFDPKSNPDQAKFATDFSREFPKVSPNFYAAINYDALKCVLAPLIRETLESGRKVNGSSLREAMQQHLSKPFSGCITGPTQITAKGDALKPMAVATVENGEVKIERTVSVSAQQSLPTQ